MALVVVQYWFLVKVLVLGLEIEMEMETEMEPAVAKMEPAVVEMDEEVEAVEEEVRVVEEVAAEVVMGLKLLGQLEHFEVETQQEEERNCIQALKSQRSKLRAAFP